MTKHFRKGLDGRMRDGDGEIRKKRNDMLVRTLREEFAYDGIHLTPKGYAVLLDAIAPHVAKYCAP